MNALELADNLEHGYPSAERKQAAALLRSQHAEIEVLKQEGKSLRLEMMAYSPYVERVKGEQASEIERLLVSLKIKDAELVGSMAENQKLRDALENIAYTTAGPDCNAAARAALGETK